MRADARTASASVRRTWLAGKYDAAQTADENRRHWANADSLAANAAGSPSVRQILRNRARYEVANNSYAQGILQTLANDLISTGPRLQMLTASAEGNRRIELAWQKWADAIHLAAKLRTAKQAKVRDGEAFALLVTNPRLIGPAKLDLRLIEADQVASPQPRWDKPNETDGIHFDEWGNPAVYLVLKQHPGDTAVSYQAGADEIPARRMLHWFRVDRPGQYRGLPELMPALPLFAELRRYMRAVVAAAETAADFAAVLQTQAPQFEDEDSDAPKVLDAIELEPRLATVLPDGYQLGQIKAEQPATTFSEFVRALLTEIARCLNVPYNVAAGDSSKHNYSSGRLDHQTYHKALSVERHDCQVVILERLLDAWLREYLAELSGISPADVDLADYPHEWRWDGFEHVDPTKEENARLTRLAAGMTSYPSEFAKDGADWEAEFAKQARALGVTVPQYQAILRQKLLGTGGAATGDNQLADQEVEDEPARDQ